MTVIHEDAVFGSALRSEVPDVAAEVTIRIRREFPALSSARYLDSLVESLVGHFFDLPADPAIVSDEVLGQARAAGVEEAMTGRGPQALQAAVRLGAGVAIARMTEHAERLGVYTAISAVGRMVQVAFAYTERVAEAVSAGHDSAGARTGVDSERHRRKLLELLLRPLPGQSEIKEAARDAGWAMPRSVAAVALRSHGPGTAGPTLPPDTLLGLHLDEPCLIMPDPDGPGRRHQLGRSLRGWSAAIGPTVGLAEAARSLRWAGHAMDLLRSGRIGADRPVRATDHLPHLMTSWGADLVDLMAADRLAPLDSVRAPLRHELEATLLALLECHFRASVAAARLHVHPQTVRYRLRKLEALFGDALYEPRDQLDLHLLLHSRLTGRPQAKPA
ncbi:PucR C-terminal helix-turn-helix domain-containing protein [Actinokineospora alba]|uniref:PucR C-terminal helix-turn-helix domain-containing protein n=1 Tax=Actinokineospora alba TaxID=504798 RepID=A0A1H0LTX8_9PSEU|nr:helix-turn-helix domain-containing protein [Actinokineospora alba]TDP67449.1 PucR-like helix-turn-helix protein [Actinokineospora alba]SDI96282.1 PucR C-terminal helix-turn-helix domain-containing protein [Actinokineospora alba]SDO71436.1 PucR C-terminal helix-turn-helix domain-containing protein [Actinokineospora alba]